MNIAAELRGTELTVFLEGSNCKKITQSFNKEMVKVGLIVYIIERERIFHDAVGREEATTHPSLIFCREELTLTDLKMNSRRPGIMSRMRSDSATISFHFDKIGRTPIP
jgi:hypothetical protein